MGEKNVIRFKEVIGKEDIIKISRLAREIYFEHFVPLIGVEQVEYMLKKFLSEKSILQQLDSGYRYIMVYKDKELAGFLALKREADKLFLSKFYLAKKFRGQGISRKMLNEVIRESNGLKTIYLTVYKDNKGPIGVYENFGFEIVDSAVTDIGSGFVMDDYIMEKDLTTL
jgi:ribosomal protein S18 acetylase RimI-like enzyme